MPEIDGAPPAPTGWAGEVYRGFFETKVPAGFGGWALPYSEVSAWCDRHGLDADEEEVVRAAFRELFAAYLEAAALDPVTTTTRPPTRARKGG